MNIRLVACFAPALVLVTGCVPASDPLSCGEGTHEEAGACVADDPADTDTGAGSDTDSDTASDSDTSSDTDSGSQTDSDTAPDSAYTVCGDGGAAYTRIQDAIDAAEEGAVISVCPGTYEENLTVRMPLTLQGVGADATRVDGGGVDSVFRVTTEGAVSIEGIEITNGGDEYGALWSSEADVTLQDCVVTGNASENALLGVAGGSLLVADTEVRDNVSEGRAVVWAEEADVTFVRDLVTDNVGVMDDPNGVYPFDLTDADFEMHNTLVRDVRAWGPIVSVWTGTMLVTNSVIFVGSGEAGVYGWEGVDVVVENSVFYGDGADNNSVGAAGKPIVVEYSSFYDLPVDVCIDGICGAVDTSSGNLTQDPRFVDVEGGDFRLDDYSPCVDAGNPSSMYDDTDGTRNDLGLYGGPGGSW